MEYAVNCSIMFKELPVPERAKAATDAGFKAVEFWWPWNVAIPEREGIDAFVTSIRDAGAQLVGLNFFAGNMPGGECGLVSLPSRADDFGVSVSVAVETGRELGCKAFNALHSLRQEGVDAMVQDAIAIDNLEFAAKATAEIGAMALVEPVSGAVGYPLKTAAQTLAVVERLKAKCGVENVGFLCDLYYLAVNGDDVVAVATGDGGAAAHCQIAGLPGRGEPRTGGLDIAGLLASTKKAGYDGWVALEYVPTVATADSFGNFPELP